MLNTDINQQKTKQKKSTKKDNDRRGSNRSSLPCTLGFYVRITIKEAICFIQLDINNNIKGID